MKEKGTQFSGRPYYHATARGIVGDTVQPKNPAERFTGNPGSPENAYAFATNSRDDADFWATSRANSEGRLFGSVYEVDPKTVIGTDGPDKYGPPSPTGAPGHIADSEGLAVRGHAGFVDYKGDRL